MKNENKQKCWTIIAIGDKRQIGSFEITSTFIITLLVVLLGLAVITPTAYWLHNKSQISIQKELAGKLTETENSLNIANQKNEELTKNNADLEDALASTLQKTPSPKDDFPIITTDEFNKMTVENFQTHIDDKKNTLHFKFLLRNNKIDDVPISGYVFVILKPDYLDSSSWYSYPKAILNGETPQNFKKGESFSVARFKTIRGTFKDILGHNGSNFVSIWIFSNNGKLMLVKDFYIKKL